MSGKIPFKLAPVLLLLATALAGCSDDVDAVEALGAGTFTLAMAEPPVGGPNGTSFELLIKSAHESKHPFTGNSDHIGGHYWTTDVADPDASFGDQAGGCTHVAGGGDVPGNFQITCNMEPGTYYLRGHLRMSDGDNTYNFWTKSYKVVIGDAMA